MSGSMSFGSVQILSTDRSQIKCIDSADLSEKWSSEFVCNGVMIESGFVRLGKDLVAYFSGNVTTVYATYDPETRSGQPGADRKINGKTLHWVNCQDAVQAEVRLYDRLFAIENPGADERDFRELLNPQSLTVLNNSVVEPYLKEKKAGDFLQFQRIGYFTPDLDSTPDHLVFNKTVGLKDTWKR